MRLGKIAFLLGILATICVSVNESFAATMNASSLNNARRAAALKSAINRASIANGNIKKGTALKTATVKPANTNVASRAVLSPGKVKSSASVARMGGLASGGLLQDYYTWDRNKGTGSGAVADSGISLERLLEELDKLRDAIAADRAADILISQDMVNNYMKEYVDAKITELELNQSVGYTKEEADAKFATIEALLALETAVNSSLTNINTTITALQTTIAEIQAALAAIDMSGYVTDEELAAALAALPKPSYTKEEAATAGLANVDQGALADTALQPGDLEGYVKKEDIQSLTITEVDPTVAPKAGDYGLTHGAGTYSMSYEIAPDGTVVRKVWNKVATSFDVPVASN
jgi:hypothetical protein